MAFEFGILTFELKLTDGRSPRRVGEGNHHHNK